MDLSMKDNASSPYVDRLMYRMYMSFDQRFSNPMDSYGSQNGLASFIGAPLRVATEAA